MVQHPETIARNIDTFIARHLELSATDTTDKVLAIEKAFNLPLGEDARKLLSAIETSATGLALDEWRANPDDLTDHQSDAGGNVVEQAILSSQEDFSNTRFIEILTNSIRIGHLSNGDGLFLNLDRGDKANAADSKKSGHILYFNHETFDLEFVFAEDLSTLIELADLLQGLKNGEKDRDEVIAAMKRLYRKTNPSWHYAVLESLSGMTPDCTDYDNARHLLYRGLWLVHLLRQDGVNGLEAVKKMFGGVERDLGDLSAFIEGFTDTSPVSASYWLWYLFFFDKPDLLSRLMTRFKDHPSPVMQDTMALIRQFQAGRKALGKIDDIHRLKNDFLALDMDPDRSEAREAEQKAAESAEQQRLKDAAAAAQQTVETTPIEDLVDLAWQHLDNPAIVENIYAHLRANDPSMALDFARYDHIHDRKAFRNGCDYDFENQEVQDALLHDSPRLHPWLIIQGRDVDAPALAAHQLGKALDDASPKTLKAYLRTLAHVAVPGLEAALIGLIPKPIVKDNSTDNDATINALRAVSPALAKIKSAAAVPHLIDHADSLRALAQSKVNETANRMHRYLLQQVTPLLIGTCRDIGTPECVAFIKSWLGTKLEDLATQALINMGDRDIVAYLEASIGSISGSPIKTAWYKVLLAYARTRFEIKTEIESAKLALRIQMHDKEMSGTLHKMALYVLARNGQPAEVRDLMLPFVDHANPEVRAIVVDALRGWGEKIELAFIDRAHVSHLYETQGRDALIPYLESDFVVYQYEILRKLSEEEGASIGLEDRIIRVAKKFTRFDFCTRDWRGDISCEGAYGIHALAAMQNEKIDDFVHSLMGHPNPIYRENKLFTYKNDYVHSPYLARLLNQPPEVRQAEVPGTASLPAMSVAFLGRSPWREGCQIDGISSDDTIEFELGHQHILVAMVVLPGTGKLYSVDESCHVIEWDENNQGTLIFHDPEIGDVESLSVSADGDVLMLGAADCFVQIHPATRSAHTTELDGDCYDIFKIYSANTYAAVDRCIVHLESGAVSEQVGYKADIAVPVGKRGQFIAACSYSTTIKVFALPGLETLKQIDVPVADSRIHHMIANHAQDRLYCACSDAVRVYDISSWMIVAQIMTDATPRRLAISPGDNTLAVASGGMLDLYDLQSGEVFAQHHLGEGISSLCFVDENCIAVGTGGGGAFKCNFN